MMRAFLPISALLFGAAILLIGNGLQGVLIPIRAGIENFATSSIGLIASAYSLGYVASCYITPRVVRRVGHIRTFAVLAAGGASVVLLMADCPTAWTGASPAAIELDPRAPEHESPPVEEKD